MVTDKVLTIRAVHESNASKHRLENQDSFLINKEKGIFIIADGMNGWNGKKASATAVKAISESLEAKLNTGLNNSEIAPLLKESLEVAQREVTSLQAKSGTTIDVGIIHNNTFHFAHVGDSRIYALHKNGALEQVTDDMNRTRDGYNGREPENDIEKKILSLTNNYMPSNWIGHHNQQDEDIVQFGTIPLMGVRKILMATDGLVNISLNNQIKEALLLDNLEEISSKLLSYRKHPSRISEAFITHLEYFLENEIAGKSVLSMLGPIFNRHRSNPNIRKMSDHYKNNRIADLSHKEFILSHFEKYPDIKEIFLNYIDDTLSFIDDATFVIIEPRVEGLTQDGTSYKDIFGRSIKLEDNNETPLLSNRITELTDENNSMPRKLNNMSNENQKHSTRVKELEKIVKLAEEKAIRELKEDLCGKIEVKEKQLTDIQKSYEALENKHKLINEANIELEKYYKSKQEKQSKEYNKSINIHEKTNNDLKSRILEEDKQHEEYKAEFTVSRKDHDELKKQREGITETILDNNKLSEDFDTLKRDFADYKSLEQERINNGADKRLSEDMKQYHENINRLSLEKTSLFEDLDSTKVEFDKYKSEGPVRIKKAVEDYKKSDEHNSVINVRIGEETSKLTDKISELDKQNQNLNEKVFRSADEILKTKEDFVQFVQYNSKYQYTKDDYDKIRLEKEKHEKDDRQKATELQDAENTINEAKIDYDKIKSEKELLEEADRQKTSELRDAKNVIDNIQIDYDEIKGENIKLNETVKQKTSEFQEAKDVINEVKVDYINIKGEKEILEEADKQKTSELRDVKNVINQIKIDYDKIKGEKVILEVANKQITSELQDAENTINEAKIDYDKIKYEKELFEKADRQKTSELRDVKKVIDNIKSNYDKLNNLENKIGNILKDKEDVNNLNEKSIEVEKATQEPLVNKEEQIAQKVMELIKSRFFNK